MCASVTMYNTLSDFNKEAIEASLTDHNPNHFTMVNFEYVYLMNNLHNTMNDCKCIIGILIYLTFTIYFVYNIIIIIFTRLDI